MAMILADSSMPARCCTAPLMPAAMYSAGRTVVPVWPIWCSLPMKPPSTAARLAPTAPPMAPASSWISWKLALLPTPAPPATITRAPFRLTVRGSMCSLNQLDRRTSSSVRVTFSGTTSPLRDVSGSSIGITPSRTVAICGHMS